MYFNQVIGIFILKSAQDIEDSVLRQNDGYWNMLANNRVVDDKALYDYFEDAICDIYDPKL